MKATVERIFAHYIEKFGKGGRYALSDKRRRNCELRLSEWMRFNSCSLEDAERAAMLAIDNLAESDWHKANGYDDFTEQIFSSYERMENRVNGDFRRLAGGTTRPTQSGVSAWQDGWQRGRGDHRAVQPTSRKTGKDEVH